MPRPPRPCLDCGQLTSARSRCTRCQQAWDRNRNHQRPWYHGDWQTRSRQARDAWVNQHGWVCPGHQRPAHPANRLELDHTTGQVLCHACNVSAGPAGH